jgi:Polysaccharide biosynthesis protein
MMTADRARVGRKMARGGILMVLLRLIGQSIGLVSTIILARLLVPEDFGLVALAMTLLGALEVTGRFGLDRALIRHQQAGRELYDTAWTLQLIRGVAMALILALTAGFWADFFDEDRLQNILYVFAVMALIKGFRNIGIVQFSRDLEFDPLFKLELRSQTGAAIASIVLALLWQSYWALILGVVVERTLLVALSYTAHPHRPRLSLEGSRYLIHFSKWVMANSIIVYLNRRSDVFILGKLASVDVVGHYSIAKQLSTLASNEIASPAARAFYSGFARTATDLERLRALYLSTLAVLLLVGLPLAVGIACVGDLVIRVPVWRTVAARRSAPPDSGDFRHRRDDCEQHGWGAASAGAPRTARRPRGRAFRYPGTSHVLGVLRCRADRGGVGSGNLGSGSAPSECGGQLETPWLLGRAGCFNDLAQRRVCGRDGRSADAGTPSSSRFRTRTATGTRATAYLDRAWRRRVRCELS